MATIGASLKLTDNVSGILRNIINSTQMTISAFEKMDSSSEKGLDARTIASARDQIREATVAVMEMENEMRKASSISNPAASWKSIKTIDMFNGDNVQRFENEMYSAREAIDNVILTQKKLQTDALRTKLLPDTALREIYSTEDKIKDLSSEMAKLQIVDVGGFDARDLEAFNATMESGRMTLFNIEQCQKRINEATQQNSVSGMNEGYRQQSELVIQLEKRINSAAKAMEEMKNNSSVEWQSPKSIDVFTNTGIDRYRQEMASLQTIMQQVNTQQMQISNTAASLEILPPAAVEDISNVSSRISLLSDTITQLEQKKLGGNNTAQINNQIEALRHKLTSAVLEQNNLSAAMKKMDVSAANVAYSRLNNIIDSTETNIRDNITEQNMFNKSIKQGHSFTDGLKGKIMSVVAAYAGMRGIGAALNISDQYTQTSARLNLMVDDNGSVNELRDKIFQAAEESRGSFMDTANTISKLGILAGDAFANNDELIAFTTLMNKSFKIGGASAQEQSAAMYQLTQAMASGRLQGDEFRSIMENAPMLAQAMADEFGVSIGELREMSSEGLITSEVIKNAMFRAAGDINGEFEKIPMTFSDIFTDIKNKALQAFAPVLEKINAIANSESFASFINGVINSFYFLADVITVVFDTIVSVGAFIYDNWSTIEPIFWGLASAAGAYAIGLGIQTAATWIANGAATTFFTTLLSNPLTWIVLLIGLVVACIYKWIQSVGGIKVAWLIVMDKIKTTWDWVCIGFMTGVYWVMNLWDKLMLGIKTASTAIQNFIGDMKVNVLMMLQNMVNGGIDIINNFIEALNNIKGVSIETIDHVTFGTTAQIENDAAKKLREDELQKFKDEISNNAKERDAALEKMKTDAKYEEYFRQNDILKAKNESDQKEQSDNPLDETPDYSSYLSDISKNTADAKDITEEDLKYLRDIAEREVLTRVTTNEFKIDMSNSFGDIKETADVDGVISKLEEKMFEMLVVSAEGVH